MARRRKKIDPNFVEKRIARAVAAKRAKAEQARRDRVYGGQGKPAPRVGASVSVPMVFTGFETNRRRH
jgi:hypothetical protein